MSKYIHYFTVVTAYTDMRENNYEEPWVSLTEENSLFEVNYNKINPKYIPLTFEITSNGNISWATKNTANTKTIEYKLNDGDWTSITSNTGSSAPSISVVSGDTVQFRGDNISYSDYNNDLKKLISNAFVGTTCEFKVKGNIMSLINSTDYANMTSFPNSSYNFNRLFQNCTGLTDASELILPATTLTYNCYSNMFQGCTSLVNAPELPATTLDESCYNNMFNDCTNLTTAPVLPATTLATSCYQNMFQGCTSLNYIKCLATDIPANACTSDWVLYVASTGTFIIQDDTENIWKFGANGIPSGWRVYNMSGEDVTDQIQTEEEIIN